VGGKERVYVDLNHDGNFSTASDLVIGVNNNVQITSQDFKFT
jgi:hypothetical protein